MIKTNLQNSSIVVPFNKDVTRQQVIIQAINSAANMVDELDLNDLTNITDFDVHTRVDDWVKNTTQLIPSDDKTREIFQLNLTQIIFTSIAYTTHAASQEDLNDLKTSIRSGIMTRFIDLSKEQGLLNNGVCVRTIAQQQPAFVKG